MSDSTFRIWPVDPAFEPSQSSIDEAVAFLRSLAPNAEDVAYERYGERMVIDAGENTGEMLCPQCNSPIDLEWFFGSLGERSESGFEDIVFTMPCCNQGVNVNTIVAEFPMGVALWELRAVNPSSVFDNEDLQKIEKLIGTAIRTTWQRI